MLFNNSPLVFILLALISTCTKHTLHQRTGVTGISVHVRHYHRKFKITNVSWASGLQSFHFSDQLYRTPVQRFHSPFAPHSCPPHCLSFSHQRNLFSSSQRQERPSQSLPFLYPRPSHFVAFLPLLHESVSGSGLSPECQLMGSVQCDRDSQSRSPSGYPSALPTAPHFPPSSSSKICGCRQHVQQALR